MLRSIRLIIAAMAVLTLLPANTCRAEPEKIYTAFSLNAARSLVESNRSGSAVQKRELRTLGGINRPLAFVLDRATGDIILVGEHDPDLPELLLDDLAVALKSARVYGLTSPGVSIDPRPNEPDGDLQDVVFFGGIENSNMGKVFYACDYLWKEIGLESVKSGIAGQDTYRRFAVDEAPKRNAEEWRVCSRFWFYPTVVDVKLFDDAVILENLRVDCLTETLSAESNGKRIADLKTVDDTPARQFSETFRTKNFTREFPVFGQLDSLARLTALAKGADRILTSGGNDYWVNTYRPEPVATPKTAKTIRTENTRDGVVVRLSGGVRIVTLVSRLKPRPNLPLIQEVLDARPKPSALTWTFAIGYSKPPADPGEEQLVERLKQALYFSEVHRHTEALREIDEALKVDPHLAEAWQLKGLIYREQGDFASSVACLQRSVRACPNYADAHFELAASLVLVDRPTEAIERFHAALAISPELSRCHLGLAYAWNGAKNREESLRCVRRFLDANPDGPQSEEARKLLTQLSPGGKGTTGVVETCRNDQYSFSFDVPAHWKSTAGDVASEATAALPWRPAAAAADPLNLNMGVVVAVIEQRGNEPDTADEIDKASKSGLLGNLRMARSKPISVAGTRGMQYVFRPAGVGAEAAMKIVLVRHEGRAYIIICSAPREELAKAEQDVFDAVIKSFRFTN